MTLLSLSTTVYQTDGSTSPWLAGLRPDEFEGSTLGEQIASAAASIEADILSPQDTASINATDPIQVGYVPFTTEEMITKAHELGILVKPWTVSHAIPGLLLRGVDWIWNDR